MSIASNSDTSRGPYRNNNSAHDRPGAQDERSSLIGGSAITQIFCDALIIDFRNVTVTRCIDRPIDVRRAFKCYRGMNIFDDSVVVTVCHICIRESLSWTES